MKCVFHIPGIICLLLVYGSLSVVNITVVLHSFSCYYHLIAYEIIAFLILMTHARTSFSHPG